MLIVIIGKVLFLFIAIWWSIVNSLRVVAKNDVSAQNIIIQAIGITGFITLQWLI